MLNVECLVSQPRVTVMKIGNLLADSVFMVPNDSPQYFDYMLPQKSLRV